MHMMGDMHVYSDHIPPLRGIDQLQPHAFPYLEIDPSIKKIEDFRMEHFDLKGYRSYKKIPMKMSV